MAEANRRDLKRMLLRLLLLIVTTMSIAFDPQKYVGVETKPASIEVENGKRFSFFITLRPASGIHINAEPPISVKPAIDGARLSVREIPKKGDYVDSSKPIKVDCTVTGVGAGLHKISFVVGYTFCSENEGWCRMGKDTLSVSVRVKK